MADLKEHTYNLDFHRRYVKITKEGDDVFMFRREHCVAVLTEGTSIKIVLTNVTYEIKDCSPLNPNLLSRFEKWLAKK